MKGKDTDRKALKLLYRSLDGDLKDKDQIKLDEALEKSAELRKEKETRAEKLKAIIKRSQEETDR